MFTTVHFFCDPFARLPPRIRFSPVVFRGETLRGDLAGMTKSQNSKERSATPPTTAQLRREGRLTRIAKALASGATVTDIAEAEGIGRTLASRTANSGRMPAVDGRVRERGTR